MAYEYEDLSVLSQAEKEQRVARLLAEPVPDSELAVREGARGEKLTYIKGDAYLIAEFNRIFGETGWSDDYDPSLSVDSNNLTWKAGCTITATVGDKTVKRTGEGACSVMSAKNPTLENIEMAIKGAATDAFKRAARKFGKRMGAGLGEHDLERALAAAAAEVPEEDRRVPQRSDSRPSNRPPQQREQGSARPGANEGAQGEICPKCDGPMWDERKSPRYGNGVAASGRPKPIFKCKDKNCNGAIWPSKKSLEEYQQKLYNQQPPPQRDSYEQSPYAEESRYGDEADGRPIADLARSAFNATDVPRDYKDPFDDD